MPVLNPNMVISISIVTCLIEEELVNPKEPNISENYTDNEKHVLELNSTGVTESSLSVIWSKTCVSCTICTYPCNLMEHVKAKLEYNDACANIDTIKLLKIIRKPVYTCVHD